MTKFVDLTPNEKLSETQFYSVVKKVGREVQLRPDSGGDITVDEEYVEKYLTSATQYDKEVSIKKTEAANLFLGASGVAMTVNFNKQVKEKDAIEQLRNIYPNKGGKMLSEVDYNKRVKGIISSVITGEQRTMIGRHNGTMNELGRVNFVDMEANKEDGKDYDTRLRLVDPRTINWMIIRGIKYNVKP